MKITKDQIEVKQLAGHKKDGSPVVYVMSKGGLHAFFARGENSQIEAIGAAPHKAIAKWLAEKKAGEIKWEDDFLTKNEDSLVKSESNMFLKLRKMIFMPKTEVPVGPSDIYIVYDSKNSQIEVVNKSEFIESKYDDYCLVRNCSLSEDAVFYKDLNK